MGMKAEIVQEQEQGPLGRTARLNGGGPLLTIVAIQDGNAVAVWMDECHCREMTVPLAALTPSSVWEEKAALNDAVLEESMAVARAVLDDAARHADTAKKRWPHWAHLLLAFVLGTVVGRLMVALWGAP